MLVVFHDMVENFCEVFMDVFSAFFESFDFCLTNTYRVLTMCQETNMELNSEKEHFLV